MENDSHVTEQSNCGIYVIKNLINGKVYVGQSVNMVHRISQHIYNAFTINSTKSHLYNSMRSYGIDNFEWVVLEQCNIDVLSEREKYWIEELNSTDRNKGYNLKSFDEKLNCIIPDEVRLKISEALKGKAKSDIHKANMITKWSKGNLPDVEAIAKRAETMRRKYEGIDHYNKGQIAWNKGLSTSNETKEKQRLAKLGKKQSAAMIEARSKGREKQVYQFDLEGNFIKIWNGTRHIESETEGQYLAQSIRGVCNGSKLFYLDSIFRYETDVDKENPVIPIEIIQTIKKSIRKSGVRSKRGSYKTLKPKSIKLVSANNKREDIV